MKDIYWTNENEEITGISIEEMRDKLNRQEELFNKLKTTSVLADKLRILEEISSLWNSQ